MKERNKKRDVAITPKLPNHDESFLSMTRGGGGGSRSRPSGGIPRIHRVRRRREGRERGRGETSFQLASPRKRPSPPMASSERPSGAIRKDRVVGEEQEEGGAGGGGGGGGR